MDFLKTAEKKAQEEAASIEQKQSRANALISSDAAQVLKEILKIIDEHCDSYMEALTKPRDTKMSREEYIELVIDNKSKQEALHKLRTDIQRDARRSKDYQQATGVTEIE